VRALAPKLRTKVLTTNLFTKEIYLGRTLVNSRVTGHGVIPYAQCPIPNAPCPMPHAQCPMPNALFSNRSFK
jgi:hypothetical protein